MDVGVPSARHIPRLCTPRSRRADADDVGEVRPPIVLVILYEQGLDHPQHVPPRWRALLPASDRLLGHAQLVGQFPLGHLALLAVVTDAAGEHVGRIN